MAIDHYSTATAMLEALRRREISSTELAEMHIPWDVSRTPGGSMGGGALPSPPAY
jgi:hypothetical protein